MIVIEPSILSANPTRLGEDATAAAAAGADALHIDIMDGRFVPNLTYGPQVVRALRQLLPAVPFHVHLMIVEPERHLSAFAEAGATILTVHQETCPHLHRTLTAIRALGVKPGVALNPSTPISTLDEVLDLLDLVLIMTVNPGFGGQHFIHSQVDKIRRLRAVLNQRGLATQIGVDGGVDTTTARACVDAGAGVLAAGSSVFNSLGSVAENLTALRAAVR